MGRLLPSVTLIKNHEGEVIWRRSRCTPGVLLRNKRAHIHKHARTPYISYPVNDVRETLPDEQLSCLILSHSGRGNSLCVVPAIVNRNWLRQVRRIPVIYESLMKNYWHRRSRKLLCEIAYWNKK